MFDTFVKPESQNNTKPLIYDCFNFFNELDLLEIRLNELYDHVDYFVLCEANMTHLGVPKPMYFKENRDLFKRFEDKIIYLPMNASEGSYLGKPQKDYVINALKNCKDNDVIIYSDLDEIPHSNRLQEGIDKLKDNDLICFAGKFLMYKLNGVKYEEDGSLAKWYGSIMSTYGYIKNKNIAHVRVHRIKTAHILEDSSWHFSSMGNIEQILSKFKHWEHANDIGAFINNSENPREVVEKFIEDGVDCFKLSRKVVYEDVSFLPEYVKNNLNKFSYIIKK